MNLKTVHVVFVTCASLLACLFGGWCLAQSGGGYTALGVASFAFAVGLVVYGVWFWRKITTPEEEREKRRRLFRTVTLLATVVWLSGSRTVWACSVCFGDAEGPLIDGARMGVFALFGLVLVMQGSFAAFFIYLWRRAKKHRQMQPPAHTWRAAVRSR